MAPIHLKTSVSQSTSAEFPIRRLQLDIATLCEYQGSEVSHETPQTATGERPSKFKLLCVAGPNRISFHFLRNLFTPIGNYPLQPRHQESKTKVQAELARSSAENVL